MQHGSWLYTAQVPLAGSMGHQHRQRHMPQQFAGDAAEYQFPEARMTVAADNEQVGQNARNARI
jgi:hypothetical protein